MFLFRDFTLDANREIRLALCQIFGVGWRKAQLVSAMLGLGYPFYLNKINDFNFWVLSSLLKGLIISDVRIKRRIEFDIAKLVGISGIRGLRHKLCLPVHGQRTRTNASTQRTKRIRRLDILAPVEAINKRKQSLKFQPKFKLKSKNSKRKGKK